MTNLEVSGDSYSLGPDNPSNIVRKETHWPTLLALELGFPRILSRAHIGHQAADQAYAAQFETHGTNDAVAICIGTNDVQTYRDDEYKQ